MDTRYATEQVVSHNGTSLKAKPIEDSATILSHCIEKEANVIGIDEVQFFDNSIVATICNLVEQGKRVIVCGT